MEFPAWNTNSIGKHILKLTDGDEIPGVFRGDLVQFYQHWINGRSEICKGPDVCLHCQNGDRARKRFRVNYIVKIDGEWQARIMEGGKRLYEQLRDLNSDMPLEKAKCRIKRTGSGKQSTYTVAIYPGVKGQVSASFEKKLSQIKLHPLLPDAELVDIEADDDLDDFPAED